MTPPRRDRAPQSVAIVGGSLAGYRTVQALRGFGYRGTIHLIGEEPHLPYDRPPLSKGYVARTLDEDQIWLATLLELDSLGVTLALGRSAIHLDPDGRRLELDDGTQLTYDAVVVATGARPRLVAGLTETSRPPTVRTLRTIEDARYLSDRLAGEGGSSGVQLVVVGAGFIGSEVAWTGLQLGADVTVIDSFDAPMSAALHSEMGEILAVRQRDAGVRLRMQSTVREIMVESDPGGLQRTEVRFADQTSVNADVIVVGVGVAPNTAWLEGSGLTLDDGLVCDAALRAHDGVFGVGDVTRWGNPGGPSRRLEHWTNAAAQAEHVARCIAGADDTMPFTNVPYYWSDQFGFRLEVIGEPPADCDLQIVWGSPSRSFVALYRRGSEVLGCVGLDARPQMLKMRRALSASASWAETAAAMVF
jgi:NADPH-dependent 2,4-dienoyl-CoA reductase/sulfur reductase-like enzyme